MFNWRFHCALHEPAGRVQALRVLRTVHHQANRYINLQLAVSDDLIVEARDHRELVALTRARDARVGVAALERHIERVAESLSREIADNGMAAMRDGKRASA